MFTPETHVNEKYKNKTLLWHSHDSEGLFLKNKSNPRIQWCLDKTIDYRFNSYGFRSDEFGDTNNLLSLGCSFTLGMGIPYESTWSYIISQHNNLANFNLAIDGCSADCCFRMAMNWIPQLKPKIVVYQNPDISRLEMFAGEDDAHNMSASSDNHNSFYKQWIIDEKNSRLNYLKNLYAIQYISQSVGAKFIHIKLSDIVRLDCARDLGHYGPKTNRTIAQQIIKQL